MEKSRSGSIFQYIDRIRITAKQDIALTEILIPNYSTCDLKNKEWKVVLSNLTYPVLDYSVTPTNVILEIVGTPYVFTHSLQTGVLEGFTSDTVTLSPNFDFSKGTYQLKAYFTAVWDDIPTNDTLVRTLIINPEIAVQLNQVSENNLCLSAKTPIWQEVILTNTGNLDVYNIGLILQIDTGETGSPAYAILTEVCTDTIAEGKSVTYNFKEAYTVPWNADYYPRVFAYLSCDSTLIDTKTAIIECVDITDLYMVSVENPSSAVDLIGSSIQPSASLHNRSDHETFAGVNITVVVENSQGVETERFTEMTGLIGTLSTVSHNFANSYTVPNDTVYYLSVYIDSYENYPNNDTITIRRETINVGITPTEKMGGFTLSQNIPNPANNSTRIDYSVPDAGKVVFHVHSITGQLLYSKTIEAARGTNSIELNTSTFAAGVYFYSMEYKGQRLVRQLIISD
jgi:hypothetical protein